MAGGTPAVISVAELHRRLRRSVESVALDVWVEGEVGGLKLAPSGHAYFSLKDEQAGALIECVMYRFNAMRARRWLSEGNRLQLQGRPSIYAPRGRLQFIGERARPAGRGALLEALARLKERLAAEGLFDPARKRPLPAEPRVVGVVTSARGAAFHDICSVAFRRGGAHIVLSPAVVQGDEAPDSLVRAIDLLERHPELDVMIVGRGGGSDEDLMAFNDERVVRRLSATRVPVVSAVGHEIDVSLADLVADVRAATPSQAAELVIVDSAQAGALLWQQRRRLGRALESRLLRHAAELDRLSRRLGDPRFLIAERQQGLDELSGLLERLSLQRVTKARQRFEHLERRLHARHPRLVIHTSRARLGPLTLRLESACRERLERRKARLELLSGRLAALSPLAILARGYAIATTQQGRLLRTATDVTPGQPIALVLHRGRVEAQVRRVHADFENPLDREAES